MSVKEMIQDIILEHQDMPLPSCVPREIEIERIACKATILLGIRRCGKTTLMSQREMELLAQGVPRKAICFLDFSDDRLVELRNMPPAVVADAYYSLFPEMEKEKACFFFDEIQNLKDWELLVNRLMNTRQCEVNITGSSADLLDRDASTAMGGRKLSWHLFPFSFAEYMRSHESVVEMPHSPGGRSLMVSAFDAYLERGGFPEAQLFSSTQMVRKYLQDTANDIVFRDIVERYAITNPVAIKLMMALLSSQISSLMSISKLHQRLTGMQVRISRPMTADYLSHFEDAFFVYLVPIRTRNLAVRNTNEKKVYLADHCLARALSPQKQSYGLMLENIVALHLIRLFGQEDVAWYRTVEGYEIDFAAGPDDAITLVQVCWSMGDQQTRKRELRAFESAADALHPVSCYIVTHDEEDSVELASCTVEIVPAWKFLLFTQLSRPQGDSPDLG